jgi:hypothetical protein
VNQATARHATLTNAICVTALDKALYYARQDKPLDLMALHLAIIGDLLRATMRDVGRSI